jgi:phage/plasmid-like protein (TIGR03299 family)
MAHDLGITNGKAAIMYAGETPWHRLGTKLESPATAEEAITAAGLDYDVRVSSISTDAGIPIPSRVATTRSDTNDVLGVVSRAYRPIQNAAAFDFLDKVVANGGLRYHTAGALGKGERVWMLAKLPGELRVKNSDDVSEKFLLLSNSHDGSSALRVFFTPIRVVCANTLSLAHRRGKGQGISILHKGNLASKIEEAQKVLGLAHQRFEEAEHKIDLMARHYPTQTQLHSFFERLAPASSDQPNSRAKNVREELLRLFEEGRGQDIPAIRHTTWAALNAVTEYVDHYRPTRGRSEAERLSRRLNSQWFGSGAALKARAWETAFAMVN